MPPPACTLRVGNARFRRLPNWRAADTVLSRQFVTCTVFALAPSAEGGGRHARPVPFALPSCPRAVGQSGQLCVDRQGLFSRESCTCQPFARRRFAASPVRSTS